MQINFRSGVSGTGWKHQYGFRRQRNIASIFRRLNSMLNIDVFTKENPLVVSATAVCIVISEHPERIADIRKLIRKGVIRINYSS